MHQETDVLWTLSAIGTLEQLKGHLARGTLAPATAGSGPTGAPLPAHVFRSKDGLIETHLLYASGDTGDLIAAVREHWVTLRDRGLAEASPIKIFVAADNPRLVVYVFRWKFPDSRTRAQIDPEATAAFAAIQARAVTRDRLPALNEIYQGFEYRRFPPRGGIELLRGKCTCTVKLDGFEGEVELDGQNGFVVMHRGPRFAQSHQWLMPVTLVAHGADSPNPFANDPRLRERPELANARVRVEQNTELPQFGIIRAQGPDADFPATAMWVVHWRIHTPMGTIITDPKVPLVFGPTTVHHYPPVGTEFKSATGPVDVINVDTNQVMGTLRPGELTAFDIVVTMDDEIPSVMDTPALYHVEMFNKYVTDPRLQIPVDGLTNDFRVPRALAGERRR